MDEQTKSRRKSMPGTNLVPDRGKWDVARAFKLKLQGLSYQEVADLVGRSKSTVVQALKDFKALLDDPDKVRTFQENEASILDAARMALITSLPTEVAVKKGKRALSPYQKVGMYGILFDKTRLLRGESTVNLNSLSALVIGTAKEFAKMSQDGEREGDIKGKEEIPMPGARGQVR
ncbi:MAG: hypothetical protein A3H45_10505 [Ignavibacteria bacterium RIFCSPLOWO2_02_FULL_55_14]|nr:MAG: hypothetical protein A3H45_10505 [Ignavibacteria bacterium RIFCSPLOWO2_02_FULL_55_14]